jgi:hypothetical protein
MSPEKKRQYNKEYWAKNKERRSAEYKQWRDANIERVKAYNVEYHRKNAEQLCAKARDRAASSTERRLKVTAQYYRANTAQVRAKQAEYYQQNKTAFVAKQAARHAAKLRRTPAWADLAAIEAVYALRDFYTAMSLGEPFEVDHIYPLQGSTVSGLHIADNLQVIHQQDNRRKSNKLGGTP